MFQDMSHSTIHKAKQEAPATLPVKGCALAYLTSTRGGRNGASQIRTQHSLTVFSAFCEQRNIGISDINNRIITDFVEYLKESRPANKRGATQVSSWTVANFIRQVKSMLKWAAEDELTYSDYVDANTIKHITVPRRDEILIETLSDQHIRALLAACKGEENDFMRARGKMIVILLYSSGIRASELVHLRLEHLTLDPGAGYLMIRQGKSRKDRRVPISESCSRRLQDYCRTWRAHVPASAPVFPSRAGTPRRAGSAGTESLTVAGLQQLLKRLAARAGITDRRVSPHNFRHAFSANFMRDGGEIWTLQRLLGHSSTNITERYIKSLGVDFNLHDRALPYLR